MIKEICRKKLNIVVIQVIFKQITDSRPVVSVHNIDSEVPAWEYNLISQVSVAGGQTDFPEITQNIIRPQYILFES